MESENFERALWIVFIGIILFCIFMIAVYIVESLIINKLHKKLYGKGTVLAFIPVTRTYLLGKVAINETVGYILVAVQIIISILPDELSDFVSNIFNLVSIALLIYAAIKYSKLKNDTSQPVQNVNGNIQNEIYNDQQVSNNYQTYKENVQVAVPQVQVEQNMTSNYQSINQPVQNQIPSLSQEFQNSVPNYKQQLQNAIPVYNQNTSQSISNPTMPIANNQVGQNYSNSNNSDTKKN